MWVDFSILVYFPKANLGTVQSTFFHCGSINCERFLEKMITADGMQFLSFYWVLRIFSIFCRRAFRTSSSFVLATFSCSALSALSLNIAVSVLCRLDRAWIQKIFLNSKLGKLRSRLHWSQHRFSVIFARRPPGSWKRLHGIQTKSSRLFFVGILL